METLGSFLLGKSRQFGPRPALLHRPRYHTETWTYDELRLRSIAVASQLRDRGVRPGDRVVLWAPNSPWWVAAYFGGHMVGAVLVPLDARSQPDFVERVVAQTEPKLAILEGAARAAWTHFTPTLAIEQVETLRPDSEAALDSRVVPDDLAELMFTSGTTGDPKGVMLTHKNILSNVGAVDRVFQSKPHQRLLSVLPLSHMFEQTVGLLLPLNGGASIYYPGTVRGPGLFRVLEEEGITTLLLVPQALQLFMDAIEREVRKQGRERTFSRMQRVAARLPMAARRVLFRRIHQKLGGKLELLVSGGAPLDPDRARKWELLGIPVLQGYGATEASPVIASQSLADRRPGSVGKQVPFIDISIEDGEVLVRGPNVTSGYWRNPAATAEALRGGWYHTGDLGEMDSDGRLYLHGRKKEMIVLSNGLKVHPEDVERALKKRPGVIDAAVIGLPPGQAPQVHAVLLLDPSAKDAASVVREANAGLAPHQQIRGFTLWTGADFPRTHTLKVKKHELAAFVAGDHAADIGPPAPIASKTAGPPAVLKLVAQVSELPVERLGPQSRLEADAGLDSLGRVELLTAIEVELGVYLDEAQVHPCTTVADLETLVKTRAPAPRATFAKWPTSTPARAARLVLQPPLLALAGIVAPAKVRGLDGLTGVTVPVLFVANHTSHLDTAAVLRALPLGWRRKVAVGAAADYFFRRRILGSFAALTLNAFPFSRDTAVRNTLEQCGRLTGRGWSILLFPEGTRSVTGEMGAFKAGIGLMAVELGMPVVPVRLEGLHEVLPKGRSVPRRRTISVTFGQPLRFARGKAYGEAAAEIERAVRALGVGALVRPCRGGVTPPGTLRETRP